MKRELNPNARKLGAYSAAVEANGTIYVSGQLGLNPETGDFASPDAAGQAEQALKNLKTMLEQAGLTMDNVVKTCVFLADIADFSAVNEVYSSFFNAPYPARSCMQVGALPRAAKVEIEAIVV